MTRQLLVLAALLFHAACIPVEDFGAYWQKTDIDKRLEGSWKRVPANPYQTPDGGYGIGSISRFVRKGDTYEMIVHGRGKEPRDRPLYPVKTLSVGRYRFPLFDDEVFRVLSEIPDDDTHWACDERFERVP